MQNLNLKTSIAQVVEHYGNYLDLPGSITCFLGTLNLLQAPKTSKKEFHKTLN